MFSNTVLPFILWLLFFLSASSPVRAAETIQLILSSDTEYYQQAAETLRNRLHTSHPELSITQILASELDFSQSADPQRLLVSIGTEATSAVLQGAPEAPLLTLFITEQTWTKLTASQPGGHRAAIFIDQPFIRYLALADILAPQTRTYSAVLGPSRRGQQAQLLNLARYSGKTLIVKDMTLDSNPLASLKPLIQDSDLFIAVPDQGIFNRNIAKWALFLSYEQKIPVIGFSSSYTKAGALASLFSSPEDIGLDGAEWIETYLGHPDADFWTAHEPRHFTVDINPSVARILNIDISSRETVTQRLKDYLANRNQP